MHASAVGLADKRFIDSLCSLRMTVDFAGRTADNVILSEAEGAKGKILRVTSLPQNDSGFCRQNR